MLKKVIEFVNKSFGTGKNDKSMAHFERAVYWLETLYPKADEAMKIAAYGHDLGRAFRKTDSLETFKDKEFNDPDILREHQREGAVALSNFLNENNYSDDNIIRVYTMVRHHEEGGSEESNWIKDADSVSFFEVNVPKFLKISEVLGKDKVRRKFDWMYERITHETARNIAEPMYRKAIESLETL